MCKKELIRTLALHFGKKVKCEYYDEMREKWRSATKEIDVLFLSMVEQELIRNVTMPQKAGVDHFVCKILPGPLKAAMPQKTGVDYISIERTRQIHIEGWTSEHDAMYKNGELARAAACYAAMPINIYCHQKTDDAHSFVGLWPFPKEWYKPTPYDRIKELSKAGALIAAEIDRLIALNDKK